ncbi:MAG TPA: GNAT family N-acetyltransferase [Vicinamibacteria bacterium]|nr:GNAT family N-acetyltransferase [Vicinamibacteria bacterium]
MGIAVRQLRPEDDRADFRSRNIDLDRFFHKYAGQNQFRHHIGTTYVAVDEGRILGFATVSPSQIDVERISAARRKRLPRYPMPVLRLARLAVDERAQGRGVGGALLKAVFVLARQVSTDYGCVGVVVDAKPDAIAFYERYGFVEFPSLSGQLGDRPEPTPMFLELGAIPDTSEYV